MRGAFLKITLGLSGACAALFAAAVVGLPLWALSGGRYAVSCGEGCTACGSVFDSSEWTRDFFVLLAGASVTLLLGAVLFRHTSRRLKIKFR